MKMDFKKELNERISLIENILKEYLYKGRDDTLLQREIFEAMEYSVMAGGKRLRPMLVLETLRLFNGNEKDAYPFMAAIEYIHTYSLVHDDLPAMDNDDYRRGRKTTHIVYGEDMAILAGDSLLNYAFETGIDGVMNSSCKGNSIKALQILSKKSGIYGMIGGQVVDIKNDGKAITLETLDYINELKTGALIEACMMMGAVLAGASDEEVNKIEKIAGNIGKAFQIQDDILDVTSTDEELGKPVHSDEKNSKSTYVTLLGIDNAGNKVKELTEEALNLLREFKSKNEFLEELILSLVYRRK